MNERKLTPDAEERRLAELIGSLRTDARAPAALRSRVMRAVAEPAAPAWLRALRWWLEPRSIQIRPAYAGAAALLAVVAGGTVLSLSSPSTSGPVAAVQQQNQQIVTRFVLVAPGAGSVQLTGDFAAWSEQGIELRDDRGTGLWTADVPLDPGVYQYVFIVDGTEWRPDPTAVSQVDDGFGRLNSVVIVSPEGSA